MNRTARHPYVHRLAALVAGTVVVGCIDRPIEPIEPRPTTVFSAPLFQSQIDKIDIVLAIDNSGSMADKQQILATAVPDLVERLVNPRCIDDAGNALPAPKGVNDKCPPGTEREFDAINDIHIGIISSSLGGHGTSACETTDGAGNPDPTKNDQGHLLTRTASGEPSLQYKDKRFLAWDPKKKLEPPGLSDYVTLGDGLRDLVAGVGQVGCGYESQLESWYRFLVDPAPVDEVASGMGSTATPAPDDVLLQQRRDFLRPDSLLAIIMLTDENDCSVMPSVAKYVFQTGPMWRARQECAKDANDPCCKSCADTNLGTCPPDPTCSDPNQPDGIARLSPDEDDKGHNQRCFDQKRRFGIEGRYPIERYVEGLTKPSLATGTGASVPNPIFSDLDPTDADASIRPPSLVFFAGIVGVPWQDIARDPTNLAKGGFKNSDEMSKPDPTTGATTWDVILGDPSKNVAPLDPMMIESIEVRTSGKNPITGDTPQPVTAARDANSINGHEWNVPGHSDLQYACVFDLPQKLDCVGRGCDCYPETESTKTNPLCQDLAGNYGTTQYRAKAYPGRRELSVLRGLGPQGIVASVCPAYIGDDLGRDDYGYRPAVGSIVERLKQRLLGKCLPRPLTPDAQGQVSCLILEARKTLDACTCDGPARDPVAPENHAAVDAALSAPTAESAGWNCFCEIPQLTGKDLDACQTQSAKNPTVDGHSVDGWCYVDPVTVPTSNESLVKDCQANEKRQVRLVGAGKGTSGSTLFITCSVEQ